MTAERHEKQTNCNATEKCGERLKAEEAAMKTTTLIGKERENLCKTDRKYYWVLCGIIPPL